MQLSDVDNVAKMFDDEHALFVHHEYHGALLNKRRKLQVLLVGMNSSIAETALSFIGKQLKGTVDLSHSFEPPEIHKDISTTKLNLPPMLPAQLESDEQKVLQDIKNAVSDESVSEFQLGFAPQWILEKSITKEKANYNGAYE